MNRFYLDVKTGYLDVKTGPYFLKIPHEDSASKKPPHPKKDRSDGEEGIKRVVGVVS